MRKLLSTLLLLVALLPFTANADIRQSAVNFADPYILLDGDYYYAYGTNHGDGIEVWRSKDLIGWEYHGLALHKNNCTEKQWFWAPEVYHKNGKYYMYFSANEHLFVATADSPLGPFYQQGGYQVENILGSEKSIDSHVFFDDDGTAWLFFVRFTDGNCIWSCKLGSDLITPVSGTLKKCINVSQSWENVLGRVTEGPNVIKHNGIYYLTYSANDYQSQNYGVGYATSSSIGSGSWTKYSGNPILQKVEDLVGTGHHTLFYDKAGNLKIAFHAHYSTSSIHPRKLYIGDMYFSGNVLKWSGNQVLRPLGATEAFSHIAERWNFSEKNGNPTAAGYDARKIRNLCYKDNKLYCVYNNESIIVLDARNGKLLGKLKEGTVCTGGTLKFCDVKCFDGHIVACNLAVSGQELRVYTWADDYAEPTLLMNTTDLHGATRLGDCMEIAPNSTWETNFWLNFAHDDGSTTRVIEFCHKAEGWSSTVWEVTTDGSTQFKTGGTARSYPNGGVFWIDGLSCKPSFFTISNGKLVRNLDIKDVGTWGTAHHEFNFRGNKYCANLKFDDRLNGRCRIETDDSGDYNYTTWLGEFPSAGLGGTTKNANGTGDVVVDTDGENYVRFFICSTEQGLACYSQGNLPTTIPTIFGDFNLEEKWNCSENANTLNSKGYDAGKINNFCYANGKLYCVYDHSFIKTLDAQTGEVLGDLPMGNNVISGGTYALSDVKYIDGKIVACNYAKSGETLKFYVWDSDMMSPRLLYSTTNLQGASALGKCMEASKDASFSGDIWLAFAEDNGTKTTIYEYKRDSSGNWNAYSTHVKLDANTELTMGDNCRVYPWGGPFWIDGNAGAPTYLDWSDAAGAKSKICSVPAADNWGASHQEVNWGNTKLAANIRFDNKKNARIILTKDITGDYSSTSVFGEYPAAGLGSTACTSGAGNVIIRTDSSQYFEAWVFAEGQGIAYLAYGNVERIEPTPSGVFSPKEVWNLSQQRGNATQKGYDATKIRNFAYQDGKLYCVYNNSVIKVLNAQTGEDYGNLNLGDIVKGGTLTLSDVKCFQGHIVACNLAKKGEELRIYAWDDDKAAPYLLYNTNDLQDCTSLGDAMDVAVNCNYDKDLWINFCCDNGTATYVVELNRNSSGQWSKYHRNLTTDGTNYFNVGDNARAYPNGGIWWITGNNTQPVLCSWSNGYPSPIKQKYAHNLGETWGGSYHEFYFDNYLYAVVPQFNNRIGDDTSSFYKGAKMRFDIVGAADHSTLYNRGSYPADGLGSAQNIDCTADVMINTDGSKFVEAWIFSTNQGLAYYTFGNVPETNPEPVEILTPNISASATSLSFSCTAGSEDSKEISVVGSKLTGVISVTLTGDNADVFSVSTTTLAATGGNISVKYSPASTGSHSAQIVLSSAGAPDVTVSLTGEAANPTYFDDNITELTQVWTNTSWTDVNSPYIRSIAFQDGKIYAIVGKPWGSCEVKILDAYTGEQKGNLDMTGVSGSTCAISGIVAVGGKIFASNTATSGQVFRIYRWDSDTSAPVVALELAAYSHCSAAMGNQISYTGDLNSGRIWASDNKTNNLIYFNVTGGTIGNTVNKLALYKADGTTAFTLGEGRGSACVQDAGNGNIYVAAHGSYPALFCSDGKLIEQMQANVCGNNYYGTAINVFSFGSKKYALAGTYSVFNSDNSQTNKGGQFSLANVTSGFAAAESAIAKYPAEAFGTTIENGQLIQNLLVQKRNDNQVLDVWFSSAIQGLGYWTYNGVKGSDAVESIEDEVAAQFGIIADANTLAVVGVEAAEIELYNAAGILVARNVGEQTIDVTAFRGLYIVKVISTEGKVNAAKVILR